MGARWAAAVLLCFVALGFEGRALADGEVAIRLTGDGGVALQRPVYHAGDFVPRDPSLWSVTWVPVCSAPCEMKVPRGTYRIGGAGIRPSHVFALDADRGDRVVLHVEKATEAAHTAGLVLLGVGVPLCVGGGVLAFIGLLAQSLSQMLCFQQSCPSSGGAELAGGFASMTFGAALLVAGAAMTAAEGSSKVEQTVESSPTVPSLPSVPPLQARLVVPLLGVAF
jgi:hypothetical protein